VDDDDDLGQDAEVAEEAVQEPTELPSGDGKLKKLQNENRSLRTRLRRSEITAKHGSDVADLIPDELPLTKWDEFAEKVAAKITVERPEQATDKQDAEASKEEPTAEEQRLAAAASGANSGAGNATAEMTPKEIAELGKTDPVRALEQIHSQYRTS
jgi:hypothetical protein